MYSLIFAVARSFQGGATFATFDQEKFDKGIATSLRRLLTYRLPELRSIIVVTCGEVGSPHAEEVIDGATPTTAALQRAFQSEISSGLIITHICTNWGKNVGSATALNDGISLARARAASHVLCWSPQIALDGFMVREMMAHMQDNNLEVCGYFRNRWYKKLQWMFAQNTCALWSMDTLHDIDDFDPACDGDGKTTVETKEFGAVPLAGMEDFHAYLRRVKQTLRYPRWGMAGMKHPVFWDLALKEPGTKEYDNNMKKIARQELVQLAYVKQLFPGQDVEIVIDTIMASAYFV